MKIKTIFPLVLLILFAARPIQERIVAVVDKEIILSSEVEFLLWQRGISDTLSEEYLRKVYSQAVDELINEKLILVAAKKESIVVSEDELNRYFKRRWEEIQSQFSSLKELEDTLKRSGYTVDVFKRKIRNSLKEELTKEKFIESKFPIRSLDRDQVVRFFETHKDSLPVLPEMVSLKIVELTLFDSIPSSKFVADSIYELIRGGVSFDSLKLVFASRKAIKFAELEAKKGIFKPELDSVIFSVPIGGVSNVVLDSDGNSFIFFVQSGDNETRTLSVIQIAGEKKVENISEYKSVVDEIYNMILRDETIPERYGKIAVREYYLDSVVVSSLAEADRKTIMEHSPGDVFSPTVFENGVRIIKFLERFPARRLELDKDYDILKRMAQDEERKRRLLEYLERIKETVYIEKRELD